MARPKKKPDPLPEMDFDEALPDIVDSESLTEMRRKLDIEDDSDLTIHVYKQDIETNEDCKIWEGDGGGSFDLGALVKTFGSGRYRVRVYASNNEGHKPLKYNRVQSWLLPPDDEARVTAAKARALNPPIETPAGSGDLNTAIQNMMAGFQATVAQILAAQNQKPDTLAEFQKFGEVMRSIIPPAPAPAGPDFMSMLNMVKTFNDVTGANKTTVPEGGSVTDALMLKAFDAFAPLVAKGAAAQVAENSQPTPGTPALPAPATLTDEEQEKIMFLQLKLRAANRAAAKGADAAEYAETIYDAFDDEDIHGFALDANWFKFLTEALPDCAAHEAWYSKVRLALIELALEDGILARDPTGNLTIPPEDDTNVEIAEGAANGSIDPATSAGESGGVKS